MPGHRDTTVEFSILRGIRYIAIAILVGFVLGVSAAVVGFRTSWYQQFGAYLLMVHMANPAIILVEVCFVGVSGSILYVERRRNRQQEKPETEVKQRNLKEPSKT